ncbi:MAG: transglutaminase domain-containing protein [Mameliella sp.]|nr:transglutaminase domain-containing protein [Phaeodactylibacter sp.]
MKKLLPLAVLFMTFSLVAQTGFSEIDKAIKEGAFNAAQDQMARKISNGGLEEAAIYELQLQSALLDRIKLDFSRDEDYVKETLGAYFPDLTAEQIRKWEESGELEMRVIEGEKRYFRNAVWNLFRVNAAAKARKTEVDGAGNQVLDSFLRAYIPNAIRGVKAATSNIGKPRTLKLTYTLRVKPDVVPHGEMVRAWLPYPRASRDRLAAPQLRKVSEPYYIHSPMNYPHSSLYMEKPATAGEWTVFQYEVSYTAYDHWQDLLNAKAAPYDTSSMIYQYYTQERDQHIRFTPEIKALAEQIVGSEQDPIQKAWLIYEWIGANIPWTSALEYSTMPNIPAYCIENQRGDCGMKALLFITLCRYVGIPAKWQSGWFLYPVSKNLHDWSELYFEGLGWVPVDPDFNMQEIEGNPEAQRFFFGGADAYRLIVNDDFSGDFFPAKVHPRSETVDFQRGEVEWRGGNLYFNQWRYKMEFEIEE